jgi:MFS family permease
VTASWKELVRGENLPRSAVVGGGIVMHAVNVFIVTTIMPSVVHEIGGLRFFAWNTTLYVVASLLAGATASRILGRLGARRSYRLALGLFALGSVGCALAPTMPALLAGRFVQGLGAGMLSALGYTMVRLLFPERLWSRALSITSAIWGIATLLGPALGGVFAQWGAWRAAFWMLAGLAPLLVILVERSLPAHVGAAAPRGHLATGSLALLAGSVLCVSAGGMAGRTASAAAGVALAACLLGWFVRRERRGRAENGSRLLPTGACNPATELGATYAAMLMLLVGMTAEIFVPYFLQTLHGATPLLAGLVSSLMSGGWSVGALASAGASPGGARTTLRAGPLALAAGLGGLCLLMPMEGGWAVIAPIGLCLASVGLGIGMCWPHLGARVFHFAPESERALAAASITTVIMVGNAFGSALGGMVTNLAGLTAPGGVAGASAASAWLFGLFVACPLLAWVAIRRSLARVAVPA